MSCYITAFQLTSLDRDILESLSTHLSHFVKHIEWLDSDAGSTTSDGEIAQLLSDQLECLVLLSL